MSDVFKTEIVVKSTFKSLLGVWLISCPSDDSSYTLKMDRCLKADCPSAHCCTRSVVKQSGGLKVSGDTLTGLGDALILPWQAVPHCSGMWRPTQCGGNGMRSSAPDPTPVLPTLYWRTAVLLYHLHLHDRLFFFFFWLFTAKFSGFHYTDRFHHTYCTYFTFFAIYAGRQCLALTSSTAKRSIYNSHSLSFLNWSSWGRTHGGVHVHSISR